MIAEFRGNYRWLSNFQPVNVMLDGIMYPSVENAYQAAKTLDLEDRIKFENCSAIDAKRYGRHRVIRPDWEEVKIDIMTELCRQKFTQEPWRTKLKDTYDWGIIEGNWWNDTFWGVCRGQGQNHLGKIIMRIRAELR